MSYAQFAILGLGAGAIYSAIALGIVLGHGGSGVVNFAYGAMAVVYVYVILRRDGDINHPVPGTPVIDLGDALPFVPSAVIALSFGAILGGHATC